MADIERKILKISLKNRPSTPLRERRIKEICPRGERVYLSYSIPETGSCSAYVDISDTGYVFQAVDRGLDHTDHNSLMIDLRRGPFGYFPDEEPWFEGSYLRLEHRVPYEVRKLIHRFGRRLQRG